MMISKLSADLGLTEAGIKVFEDVGSNEQRETTRPGIMRMHACYEDRAKERKGICPAVMLRTRASTPTLFNITGDDPGDPPIIQENIAPS
jgi:hypothetical protein